MTLKHVIAAIIVALSLAAPAAAGVFEDGVAAYNAWTAAYSRGDYTTAVRILRPWADKGFAKAQSDLGFMYASGLGVPQNDAEAVRWFRLAANKGLAEAQRGLGVMYSDGRGVPQDDTVAVKWFRLAADQGMAEAQFGLGVAYREGRGVPQNYAEAAKWLHLAAHQGLEDGQFLLGAMYANGRGVPQDYVRAHMWFNLAAVSARGAMHLWMTITAEVKRDELSGLMTQAQIAEAQRLAREWKPTTRPER